MNLAATQIASRQFDDDYFRLPVTVQARVRRKLDEMGSRLTTFPHYRMVGSDKYRLRVGDYRLIYRFDLSQGEIYFGGDWPSAADLPRLKTGGKSDPV